MAPAGPPRAVVERTRDDFPWDPGQCYYYYIQRKSVERKTVCCTIMMLMTAFGILAPFYGTHGKLGVANGGKIDMVVKAGIRVRHPHRS